MKKSKQILAFELLEKEMEIISKEQQITFVGGSGYSSGDYASGGIITVGPVTATGVSQSISMSQTFFGGVGSWIQEGMGINSVAMSANGNIGLSQNPDGSWRAGASFAVTPPPNFSNAGAQGNVSLYINGEYVSGFGVFDTRSGSGAYVYTAGTIPTYGSMNLPAWYDGTQTVEFKVGMGATSRDGAGGLLGYVGYVGSSSLTVPHY